MSISETSTTNLSCDIIMSEMSPTKHVSDKFVGRQICRPTRQICRTTNLSADKFVGRQICRPTNLSADKSCRTRQIFCRIGLRQTLSGKMSKVRVQLIGFVDKLSNARLLFSSMFAPMNGESLFVSIGGAPSQHHGGQRCRLELRSPFRTAP